GGEWCDRPECGRPECGRQRRDEGDRRGASRKPGSGTVRRPTRLVVVGDTRYGPGVDHPVATWEALARQLAVWAEQVDELIVAGVWCVGADRPVGFADIPAGNVRVVPLRAAGGPGLRHKAAIVVAAVSWLRALVPLMAGADAVHVRCPCNV